MNYHIEVKNGKEWERIASFLNDSDRDYCKMFLAEMYNDCSFKTKNEE